MNSLVEFAIGVVIFIVVMVLLRCIPAVDKPYWGIRRPKEGSLNE